MRAYDTFSPPDVSGLSSAFAVTTPITVAPSVPSGLAASSVTASQVVLVWNASSDSCAAVAGYRIYRNGTQIATSAGTSYTDTTVAGGTTYSYTVAAYDSTGANASAQTSALSVTTPASIYQITNSTGQSLSSLYSTKIVPAICGPVEVRALATTSSTKSPPARPSGRTRAQPHRPLDQRHIVARLFNRHRQ